MNVFELRKRLIDDYSDYVRSFVSIRDERIRQRVETDLADGLLWPEPRIGLNPAFAPGAWIEELVKEGVLHSECAKVFRLKTDPRDAGRGLRLHKHQVDAIHAARAGRNYVLMTGTGSGKSLSYIVPIVDHVLRSERRKSIKAIVVYPMNALANSQAQELTKFLCYGNPDGKGPVFKRYTGQESDEERLEILANPPDILLTNYVMLELILTRTDERKLVSAAKGLRFLVLDELHTYRGRQGADVALLVRRARNACDADRLQHVGTSATMTTRGTFDEQRTEVARVASLMFGAPVTPEDVIGETVYATTEAEPERYITVHPQTFVPGDRRRRLFPLAFCRECGQEYYTVSLIEDASGGTHRGPALRRKADRSGGESWLLLPKHNRALVGGGGPASRKTGWKAIPHG